MPQAAQSPSPAQRHTLPSFQIAQGEREGAPRTEGGETHATTEQGAEHEHSAGEVPNAMLLFSNSILIAVAMIAFALVARKKLTAVPKGIGNLAEYIVESMNNFTVGIIGHGGERYTPLVGTVFLYILLMNLIGQIPGLHSPSANLSITLALGIVVFVYVQAQGIRQNGLGGYVRHFMGPSITGKFPELFFLMGPIELISEIIKPFTLAVRLFGNIFGEDVIIIVLAGLGAGAVATSWIPIQLPIMLLALLTAFVQAMVFSILTCIYISLLTHHEGEEHGDEGAHDAAHAHAAGH